MDVQDVVKRAKDAYLLIGKIPSRGARSGSDDTYAGASAVIKEACKLLKDESWESQPPDWLAGFDNGFEWSNGDARWQQCYEGFVAGRAVAEAVFNWPEAPRCNHPHIIFTGNLQEQVDGLRLMIQQLQKQVASLTFDRTVTN